MDHRITGVEVVRPITLEGPIRAALFDFDGTLSYIREDWPTIMLDMMIDEVRPLVAPTDLPSLRDRMEDFIMALNGKATIHQTARFAEEVRSLGGSARTADEYKARFLERLTAVIEPRCRDLATGAVPRSTWLVPGAEELLLALRERGVRLYLASGSDEAAVRREAELLGVAAFFAEEIHAARTDGSFSKRAVVERILADNRIPGRQVVGFGDGVVETQEIKAVGGTAIAVAGVVAHPAQVHQAKRTRLIAAGADWVIPHYLSAAAWLPALFPEASL